MPEFTVAKVEYGYGVFCNGQQVGGTLFTTDLPGALAIAAWLNDGAWEDIVNSINLARKLNSQPKS